MNDLWYVLHLYEEDDLSAENSVKFFTTKEKAMAYVQNETDKRKASFDGTDYVVETDCGVEIINNNYFFDTTVTYPDNMGVFIHESYTIGEVITKE